MTSVTGDYEIELSVERTLLAIALQSARQSLPLVALVMGYVTYLGIQSGAIVAASTVAALGFTIGIWRFILSRHIGDPRSASLQTIRFAQINLQTNAGVAGLLWAIATIWIYPSLGGLDASAYLVLVFGSIAVGSVFMAAARRAFATLLIMHLLALMITLLRTSSVDSAGFAILTILYSWLMLVASQKYRSTTVSEIRNRLLAEYASAQLVAQTAQNEKLRQEQNERETRLLRAAREEAASAAARSIEVKNIFVARCSHELRTPLQTITSSCELLEQMIQTLPLAKSKSDSLSIPIRRMVTASNSLLFNAQRLGELVRVESGHLNSTPTTILLQDWLDDVTSNDRRTAISKGLNFVLNTHSIAISVRAESLREIVSNLVSNAVKYTDTGEVTVTAKILFSSTGSLPLLEISVCDTGCGIPEALIDTVYEPWTRGVSKERGWGIGLTIVREVTKSIGGQLKIESEQNKGTHAKVAVPVDLPNGNDYDEVSCPITSPINTRVLLVDDDEVMRLSMAEVMRHLGIDCVETPDAVSALALIGLREFDVVLTDIQMPNMDGYALAEKIKHLREGHDLPRVIAMSAYSIDPIKKHLFSGFLSKPFSVADVAKLIVDAKSPNWAQTGW
jgi:signal transduction histidine kinase/CheY-like chemotaxis protein